MSLLSWPLDHDGAGLELAQSDDAIPLAAHSNVFKHASANHAAVFPHLHGMADYGRKLSGAEHAPPLSPLFPSSFDAALLASPAFPEEAAEEQFSAWPTCQPTEVDAELVVISEPDADALLKSEQMTDDAEHSESEASTGSAPSSAYSMDAAAREQNQHTPMIRNQSPFSAAESACSSSASPMPSSRSSSHTHSPALSYVSSPAAQTAPTPMQLTYHMTAAVIDSGCPPMPTIVESARSRAQSNAFGEEEQQPPAAIPFLAEGSLDIGMLAPSTAAIDSQFASNATFPSSTTEATPEEKRKAARARRTRFTTAAAASDAARASVAARSAASATNSPSTSISSISMPSPIVADSQPATKTRNRHPPAHLVESASSTASDVDFDEEEDGSCDDDRVPGLRAPGTTRSNSSSSGGSGSQNKRKRLSTLLPASASQELESAEACHLNQLKGLDKRERNKLSASMYRKRRKIYLDSLEGRVGELDATISQQADTIARLDDENRQLKEQLGFLKKMMSGLKLPIPGWGDSAPAQPSNFHYGATTAARKGSSGASSLASTLSMIFMVLCCILLFSSTETLNHSSEVQLESAPVAPLGRMGRTLLSVDETTLIQRDMEACAQLADEAARVACVDQLVGSFSDIKLHEPEL